MAVRTLTSMMVALWVHSLVLIALFYARSLPLTKYASDDLAQEGPEFAISLSEISAPDDEATRKDVTPPDSAALGYTRTRAYIARRGAARLEPAQKVVREPPPTDSVATTKESGGDAEAFSGVLRRPGQIDEEPEHSAPSEDGTPGNMRDVGGLRAALAEHDRNGGGLVIAKYVMSGAPPIETINRIIQENELKFRRCAHDRGSIVTTFRISTEGHAVITHSDIGEGILRGDSAECLEQSLRKLRFPLLQREILMQQTFAFAHTCLNCGLQHVVWLR
jgi:hypothetical protein